MTKNNVHWHHSEKEGLERWLFKVALNQLVEAMQLHMLLTLWCFYCSITLWLLQYMATLRDQLIAICKVNQQHKYCLVKTICVITWNNWRLKLFMLITSVFSNIVINCSKGKHFNISMHYFSHLICYLKVIALLHPRKVAKDCQKTIITNRYVSL